MAMFIIKTYLKQDQVHGHVDLVVVVERVDEQLVQLGVDVDRHVLGVADALSKMTVHERLLEDFDVVEVLEDLLDHFLDDLVEQLDVAGIDEFVAVDAVSLVDEQTHEVDLYLAALGIRKQHTLPTHIPTAAYL